MCLGILIVFDCVEEVLQLFLECIVVLWVVGLEVQVDFEQCLGFVIFGLDILEMKVVLEEVIVDVDDLFVWLCGDLVISCVVLYLCVSEFDVVLDYVEVVVCFFMEVEDM